MVKKPKRRLSIVGDHVIGAAPRDKKDLYAGCNEPGKPWFNKDAHVFISSFCKICRNADCIRAAGVVDEWQTRMSEQVDYLLNDPIFSDLQKPEHREIAQMAFNEIGEKMQRLELARETQDWSLIKERSDTQESEEEELEVSDGVERVVPATSTRQFDEAVEGLSKKRGTGGSDVPAIESSSDAPIHFQGEGTGPNSSDTGEPGASSSNSSRYVEKDPKWEYETLFPSDSGAQDYHITLSHDGQWKCDCPSELAICPHLEEVIAWYRAPPPQSPPIQSLSPSPSNTETPPITPNLLATDGPINTPTRKGGVMVDDSKTPNSGHIRSLSEERDPWEIPSIKTVEPGAQVTLRSNPKGKSDNEQ